MKHGNLANFLCATKLLMIGTISQPWVIEEPAVGSLLPEATGSCAAGSLVNAVQRVLASQQRM